MAVDTRDRAGPAGVPDPDRRQEPVNSFALLQDDGSVTLVDTGLKRAPARIVAGLAALGKHPRDVTRIVLTHVHPDHAGGAAEMSRQTGAPVLVHGDDHGWARTGRITGANDRSTALGRLFARTGDARSRPSSRDPPSPTARCCRSAAACASSTRPATPPATSPCWSRTTGMLITGDALFNFPWMRRARISPAFLCSDFAMTQRTAHRLGELEYDVAAFTHGPEITDRARETVRGILAGLPGA